MNYMETVIIITELKLTTTVNDNIHELYIHELYEFSNSAHGPRQHLKSRAFSTRAFSHIGRFRLTPLHLSADYSVLTRF